MVNRDQIEQNLATLKEQKFFYLTIAELAAQEGYNLVIISMYFCIASSGGIDPNFCHACLVTNNINIPAGYSEDFESRAKKMMLGPIMLSF